MIASPAAADDFSITSVITFAAGASDVGPAEGFTIAGHFDVGVTLERFRLQAQLDTGIWLDENAPEAMPERGSYKRLGGGLRYYWADIDVPAEHRNPLRLYVEGGLGRQTIDAPSVDIERTDLAIGFGMQQELRDGGVLLGGHFGLRLLFAPAPSPVRACGEKGGCINPTYRAHDIALIFQVGLAVGR